MGGAHFCSPVAEHFVDKMWPTCYFLICEALVLKCVNISQRKLSGLKIFSFFPRGLNLIEDVLLKLSLGRLFVVVQCEQRRLSFTVKSEHNIDLRVGSMLCSTPHNIDCTSVQSCCTDVTLSGN